MSRAVRARALGWRAHAALRVSDGVARVTACLSRSLYAYAAGELIWVGEPGSALHPRAVLVEAPLEASTGRHVEIACDRAAPWRPAPSRPVTVGAAASRLRAALGAVAEPRGLATAVVGNAGEHDPVVRRARGHVEALARACADDDPSGFHAAALPLLGLVNGLTPSGDDLVGGALFARRMLVGADATWHAAAAAIVTAAADRTHPISARLLADLAAGEGWAPLHDLAAALGDDAGTAVAVRHVIAIGHTSGADLLAGVLIAVEGATVAPGTAGTTS